MGTTDLLKLLVSQMWIDAPDTGRVSISYFEKRSLFWPGYGARWHSFEPVALTQDASLIFAEYAVLRSAEDAVSTMVLYVFDTMQNEARIYSDAALSPEREATIAQPNVGVEGDQSVVSRLLTAMRLNDLDAALALFSPDACFAHSDGQSVCGQKALHAEFSGMLGETGLDMPAYTIAKSEAAIATECRLPNGRINAGVYELDPNNQKLIISVRTYM